MNRIDAKPGQDEHVSALDRLPDEILVPIVRLVQRRSPPEVDTPRNTWSRMMLVSNRMRTLIVETPSLWCCINNSWHPRWVELCVERSANYPLEVILGMISVEASALARAILTRSCDAVIYTARNFALVEIMLKRPGLQLRSLHSVDARGLFGAALAATWSLDARLFGGYSASLVHLKVESAFIKCLSGLPCLRHISFRLSLWAAEPSLATQLSQHTPNLVDLNIQYIAIRGYVFTDKLRGGSVHTRCQGTRTRRWRSQRSHHATSLIAYLALPHATPLLREGTYRLQPVQMIEHVMLGLLVLHRSM
jgi:hypothetical protein